MSVLDPGGYVYLWRYEVPREHRAEFQRVYGPEGDWVALFRTAAGYLHTELLQEADTGTYLTIDAWASREHFDRFRSERAAEFEALDRRCERLTTTETPLGHFTIVRSTRDGDRSRRA